MDKFTMKPLTDYTGEVSDFEYYMLKAYGASGKTGVFGLAGVPKKYKLATMENLPIEEDNPEVYKAVRMICKNVDDYIEEGLGLYLYSSPNSENPRGTGTGKTTTAITILNHYLMKQLVKHVNGEKPISDVPAMFVKASRFQNLYNSQFRGTQDEQQRASSKFYKEKKLMIETDLLVLDDIALRSATETFVNEMYEIIDERATEERAIILTSNEPIETVGKVLSEQIRSRIEGSCEFLAFEGTDKRRKFL